MNPLSAFAPVPCEVIVLTALPVEYQAVVPYLQEAQEIVHPSGTIYRWGTFPGAHRIWHVAVAEIGMGSTAAALEAEKALSFLQAQIALFVGVAGGLKDVQRGDVVAATKIYAYESGKARRRFEPRPELGHSSHALEQRARAEAREQAWLARLDGPRPDPVPQVLIGALAAGEKVLASTQSSLARLLKKTYGDALAIEMEGHGFLHAVRLNHTVHGLVIRGISDLIDDKGAADAAGTQRVAARHAAAFAFQVLTTFVLPPSAGASWTRPSSLLNLPFDPNPFFTGREAELRALHTQLWQHQHAAIGHKSVMSGLGGVGKTQLAVAYAYRHHSEYQYVLWALAENIETLIASYSELARLLNLPEKESQEQGNVIQAVKGWLQRQHGWLLILDNADRPDLLPSFLPPTMGGHLLLTTRAANVNSHLAGFAHPLVVESFSDEQAALFLLHRSGLLALDATLDEAEEQAQHLAMGIAHELGGLPLALDQVGAYINETKCSLAVYQQMYQQRRAQLLAQRRGADHPEPVMTTWDLSFQSVGQQNPAAADLLRLCAFLAPDAIPEAIVTEGAQALGPILSPVAADSYLLNQAIESLRAYSLITRDPHTQTLSIHRLVQAVLRDRMPAEIQQQWMRCAIQAVAAACPSADFANWPTTERLLPHALTCASLLESQAALSPEEVELLNKTALYLLDRARHKEAEPLFQRVVATLRQSIPDHSNTAAAIYNLARTYYWQGRYAEAEPLFLQARAIDENALGGGHLNMAIYDHGLAQLYKAQGRYREAEHLYRQALTIREHHLGRAHYDLAEILGSLGKLYIEWEKFRDAEPLILRAIELQAQHRGREHPETMTLLNDLADLYFLTSRDAVAEPLYQQVLQFREKQLGPIHPLTATAHFNMAKIELRRGQYQNAEHYARRALEIYESTLGQTHPYTAAGLSCLAEICYQQGDYQQAETYWQQALIICEQQEGSEHPHAALCLYGLAMISYQQGDYQQAETYLQRTLTIQEPLLGSGHSATRETLKSYLQLLRRMERESEASQLEERLREC